MVIIQEMEAVFEDGKLRLLEPAKVPLVEGQRVRVVVEATSEDVLALAGQVYTGLSEEEIDAIERIALDRDTFFVDPAP